MRLKLVRWGGLICACLFALSAFAAGDTFQIGTPVKPGTGKGPWLNAAGSATVSPHPYGLQIRFNELKLISPYRSMDPQRIASVYLCGSRQTDSGWVCMLRSERLPVQQVLSGGGSLVVDTSTPVFMQQPAPYMLPMRFRLVIEFGGAEAYGTLYVDTTMDQLTLNGNRHRVEVEMLDEHRWDFGVVDVALFLLASYGFFRFMRRYSIKGMVFGVLMVFFMVVWVAFLYPMLRGASTLFWQETEAEILDIGVNTFPSSGSGRNRSPESNAPVIKYRYWYNGHSLTSTQLETGHQEYSTEGAASDSMEHWNRLRLQGTKVPAWVNPLDSSDAVLRRSPNPGVWLGSLVWLCGMVLVAMLMPRREPEPFGGEHDSAELLRRDN